MEDYLTYRRNLAGILGAIAAILEAIFSAKCPVCKEPVKNKNKAQVQKND